MLWLAPHIALVPSDLEEMNEALDGNRGGVSLQPPRVPKPDTLLGKIAPGLFARQ